MTLLDKIHSLKDDDRVELRVRYGDSWQISSYPAKELKGLFPSSALEPASYADDWTRYGKIVSGKMQIPEPDANTLPDFNS